MHVSTHMNPKSVKVRIYAKLPTKPKLSFVGAVTPNDYKLIRNRIIGHGEGGLKFLVTNLLEKAGWDLKRDERNIFAPVTEIFMQTPDIDLKKFTNFVERKESKNFFTSYLRDHNVFNLYDMFEKELRGIYPREALVKLIDDLWSVTTCVNQTGVGPGEICLSVITNASKSTKGDLTIPGIGNIEVKSTFGRLGSGDNCMLFPERIKQLFAAKRLSITAVRKQRALLTAKKQKTTDMWSWNEALQTFFLHDWGFSKSTILSALAYISTEPLTTNQHGRLVAALKQLIKNSLPKLFQGDRYELIKLVLTIQLCTYQATEQFPFLLSVDRKTKNAYSIFFSDNMEKNVLSVYNQITRIGRFSSNLGVDSEGTRKGVELNFH